MPYPALDVARRFLALGEIDPLKLQKLVFLAHGWHLAVTDEPLTEETFQAWDYGPVVPSLYRTFSRFGASPIQGEPEPGDLDDTAEAVIGWIWEDYGKMKPWQLVQLTHEEGTPWATAYQRRNNTEIDNEAIKSYYKGKLQEAPA